jgi:hypothetical protein
MNDLFANIDILNISLGALFSGVITFVVWVSTRWFTSHEKSRDLPYKIKGTWYSAEYDPKGEIEQGSRNTFTKVNLKRKLGGRVKLSVEEQLDSDKTKLPTKWEFKGKIVQSDYIVGTWYTTLLNTKRHGTALFKFLDYGRAIGYWTGTVGQDRPFYGYVVLSRDEDDVRDIGKEIIKEMNFKYIDVAKFVSNYPPQNI